MIRYADDFVVCFEHEADAIGFRKELGLRLCRFGLEISPEKTKTSEFGPYAQSRANSCGGKAATFDFLGFTHYCSWSKNGRKFRLKRKNSRKKFTAKIQMFRDWLTANRTLPTNEFMDKVAS
jgi:RNA-directed DNA polymerase